MTKNGVHDSVSNSSSDQSIAIIVNNYPPKLGGLESHVFHLAKEMHKLGTSVIVFCLADEPSDTFEDGIRVIRLRMHLPIASVISFPGWGATALIARTLRHEGIRVVSTHTRFFPMSYVAMRAAARVKLPVIHTEHGAGYVRSPSKVIELGARVVDKTVGRLVLRRATTVLAVSSPVAQFVEGLAGVKSTIFHNALSLDDWTAGGDSSSPTNISFLGRLVPGKGWEDFIDVASLLIRERGYPRLRVHIFGDGPDMAALRTRVVREGIQENVIIHGHSGPADVKEVLRSGVLVNPSRLAEGFQITLLEAAAAGAQIVSYPVPSVAPLRDHGAPIREVIQASVEALLDSTEDALRNPLPVMPQDSLANHWSWPARARDYLNIVTSVARRSPDNGNRAEGRIVS